MALVKKMNFTDIDQVASVHAATFPRQLNSFDWINCNFNAYPRVQYFVIEVDAIIVGFIEWLQKSGFRNEVVAELEQLAVLPPVQGKGYGRALIEQSLPLFIEQLDSRGASLKHVLITTRADNYAQNLYKKTLGATVEANIVNLYSADEVIMIARHIKL